MQLTICSTDILGIADEDTWNYGEQLLATVKENNLRNVTFVWPQSMLGMLKDDYINRETYLATANICRRRLETDYSVPLKSLEALIHTDQDAKLTYCGMLKFLETEMLARLAGKGISTRRKVYKETAKKMMQRSEAFTLAIRTLRPLDVRLSMHPSSGAVKLSIPLIPSREGDFQKSPWHSCVVMDIDGSYRCVHSAEVKETHDLIYRGGQPYFYRERSPLLE